MTLELQNIGMIKEAKVNIDGLTVIAGENDTGKSTVGKALFYQATKNKKIREELKNINQHPEIQKQLKNIKEYITDVQGLPHRMLEKFPSEKEISNYIKEGLDQFSYQKLKKGFDKQLSSLAENRLQELIFYFQLSDNSLVHLDTETKGITFIDTPILANFFDFFSMLDTVQNEVEYEVNNYPYLSRSLFKQLRLTLKKETTLDKYAMLEALKKIIGGELKTDSMGKLVFVKNDGSTHSVNAVATGIKNFGILQLLIKNNYLTKDAILIVDEPEVHLHPKWQLKYAEFIVNLVQNGVKVFINSHSPYMIEALKRYSDKANLQDKTNFYLAEGGYIENKNKLQEIYEKLSEPYDEFDRMDSDILNGK